MFSRFLNAIQSRLAGVLVAGVFHRFETHQAIQDAELQASLESKVKLLREQGCNAAAEQLETRLGQAGEVGGAAGVAFANALLADSYHNSTSQPESPEPSLVIDSHNADSDVRAATKQRGKKKRPASDD